MVILILFSIVGGMDFLKEYTI